MNLTEAKIRFPKVLLNEKSHTVSLNDGVYKHFLNQPSDTILIQRDNDQNKEVILNKNRKVIDNDAEYEGDVLDAKFYDLCQLKDAEGYLKPVPMEHKANAFRNIYFRQWIIPEGTDLLADVIPVLEIFGTESKPIKIVVYMMKQPGDKERRRMLKLIRKVDEETGKNGKIIVTYPSYLIPSMEFFKANIESFPNAYLEKDVTEEGSDEVKKTKVEYSPDVHGEFVAAVDPLCQRMIVKTYVEAIDAASRD